MLARIVMFGIFVLAAWLIWRALRGFVASRQTADSDSNPPRLGHQRNDKSTSAWVGGGAAASSETAPVKTDSRNESMRSESHESSFDSGDSGGGDGGGD